MRTLRAKFQIKSNICVHCHVEVEDVSDTEFRIYVGVKRRGDTVLPIGSRIYIFPENMKVKKDGDNDLESEGLYETASVQVLKHVVYEGDGSTVHLCTPIQRKLHKNLRSIERKPASFELRHGDQQEFSAENATTQGLGLLFKSEHPILAMTQDREYTLTATHKDKEYDFPGIIKHILYNWKTYEHRIGFELNPLDTQKEIVLNILIDPEYKTDLSASTVDAASGKITGG